MAFEDYDEYEQSEQVRKWLRENGLSIVIGVALALALIFGWRQWQAHRAGHHAQAAEQFATLESALLAGQAAQMDKAADSLEKDYADTPYAALAAAARANMAVGENKLDAAHKSLQWAIDHSPTPALHSLYGVRLARVELAQNQARDALATLDAIPAADYRALRQELRGDALLKLGRAADARAAYEQALAALPDTTPPGARESLEMKLDDLAPTGGAPSPTTATSTAKPGKQGT
ncbi:MAG TPA: tetratricopeptide repeat protein [Rhodanobacteraceae bacterium]|nr:tetratricopeptide repeat protein [Rhodanobacteraceae bacterium]